MIPRLFDTPLFWEAETLDLIRPRLVAFELPCSLPVYHADPPAASASLSPHRQTFHRVPVSSCKQSCLGRSPLHAAVCAKQQQLRERLLRLPALLRAAGHGGPQRLAALASLLEDAPRYATTITTTTRHAERAVGLSTGSRGQGVHTHATWPHEQWGPAGQGVHTRGQALYTAERHSVSRVLLFSCRE